MARARARSTSSATHDFECDEPGCGFTSTGWDTKAKRDERGRQHRYEHAERVPMPELAVFRGEREEGWDK